MANKTPLPLTGNDRKRKRIIPTRAAGTKVNPSFENPADELFAEAFKGRQAESDLVDIPNSNDSEAISSEAEVPYLPDVPDAREAPTGPTLPTLPKAVNQNLKPVSPEKDFAKVANSIVRVALPDGWFIGKSKQIYDYIYSVTRAAIKPTRSIRLTKPQLMRGSDCRAEKSLLKNIAHLKNMGLLKVTIFSGEHGGNEYEVVLPEEIPGGITLPTLPTVATLPTLPTDLTHVPQKVGGVPPVVSTVRTVGLNDAITTNYGSPNTSFKDNIKTDDEFAPMIGILRVAAEEVSGKKGTAKNSAAWADLANVLALELKIAAARTDGVSNPAAFLTEVLRRRLLSSRSAVQDQIGAKVKPDTIGRPEAIDGEIKPLDEKGREAALSQLQEFAGDDFLEEFSKWYTPEDWQWIKEHLA